MKKWMISLMMGVALLAGGAASAAVGLVPVKPAVVVPAGVVVPAPMAIVPVRYYRHAYRPYRIYRPYRPYRVYRPYRYYRPYAASPRACIRYNRRIHAYVRVC